MLKETYNFILDSFCFIDGCLRFRLYACNNDDQSALRRKVKYVFTDTRRPQEEIVSFYSNKLFEQNLLDTVSGREVMCTDFIISVQNTAELERKAFIRISGMSSQMLRFKRDGYLNKKISCNDDFLIAKEYKKRRENRQKEAVE